MKFRTTLIVAGILGCASSASYAAIESQLAGQAVQEIQHAKTDNATVQLIQKYADQLGLDLDNLADIELADQFSALGRDDRLAISEALGVAVGDLESLTSEQLAKKVKEAVANSDGANNKLDAVLERVVSDQISKAAVYAALPTIGLNMDKFMLSDMRGRLGTDALEADSNQRFWVQAKGGQESAALLKKDAASAYGVNQPKYRQDVYGLQVGGDLWRSGPNRAGVFAGVGAGSATINGPLAGRAGKISSHELALGAYFNHANPSGWYVDTALQISGQEHKMRTSLANSGKDKLNVKAMGLALQAETGYQFKLGDGYTVTPNVSVLGQMIRFKNPKADASTLTPNYGRQNAVTSRLAMRMTKSWEAAGGNAMQVWVEPAYSHQFIKVAKTTVALNGASTELQTDLPGGSAGASMGFSGMIDKTTTIGVSAGYMKQIKEHGHSISANLSLNKAF